MARLVALTVLLSLAMAGGLRAAESTAAGPQQPGVESQVITTEQQQITSTTTTYTTWMQRMINGLGSCGQNKKFYNGNSGGTCM